ncbi:MULTISPECIES: hypothetical protein [Brevundimonas]|uniref:hypothetical protein n=1 Tax=Brevundimonas TaxID=41275 RepID=UPI0005ED2457|nr:MULTISPECIES: hypothetical protein [Brevundimonas]
MTTPDQSNPLYFGNPLRSWTNPDILYDARLRCAFEAEHPDEYAVVDWPELRAAFQVHEDRAKTFKKRSRGLGLRVTLLAGLGAALVPLSELLQGQTRMVVLALALGAMIAGFVLAIWHMTHSGGQRSWLSDRLQAERLRAGYFHTLIEHFALADRARTNPEAKAAWARVRSDALRDMSARLRQEADQGWDRWLQDGALHDVWATGAVPPDLDRLQARITAEAQAAPDRFAFVSRRVHQQRLQVQQAFSALATLPSTGTAQGRQGLITALEHAGVLATPVFAVLAAIEVIRTAGSPGPWLVLMGAASAIGLTMRLLDKGLRIRAEAYRYWDYRQRVAQANAAYDDAYRRGDVGGQVGAMFALERHAYWETRQFLLDHRDARFLD